CHRGRRRTRHRVEVLRHAVSRPWRIVAHLPAVWRPDGALPATRPRGTPRGAWGRGETWAPVCSRCSIASVGATAPSAVKVVYTLRGQELRFLKGLGFEREQRFDRRLVLPFDSLPALHDRRLESGEVLVVPTGQALLLHELPQPLDQVQV